MTALSDAHKAMSLFRKYIRCTDFEMRKSVNTSMPIKLPVKRFDGSYRTKLIPNDIDMKMVDAYFSKKSDLITVFEIVASDVELPSELQDVQYIEIASKLLGDRLASGHFSSLMKQISEVTDSEITVEDAYATPVNSENYDVMEAFGSWS